MGDFDFSGQYVQSNTGADKNVGGQDVPFNTVYTPSLGFSPGSGMSTFGTLGDVIILNSIDPSGTIYEEVSGWMGTVAGGATDYATISTWGGTYAKSGTTPSISMVSDWGGTFAKSGTTPSYETMADWGGTYAQASTLAGLVDLTYEVSEPQGFVNRTSSTLSFIGTTFSITGTHSIYCGGTRFEKPSVSVDLPPAYGMYFIQYNNEGVLGSSMTPWDISLDTPIAGVFYSVGGTSALLLEERHGVVMDAPTHAYLHYTRGSQYKSGFAVAGFVINSGILDNVQYSVGSGEFYDEDILNSVTGASAGGPYTIMYRTGASGEWTWRTGLTLPILQQGIPIAYNQFIADAWQLTAVSVANSYLNYYVFATNSLTADTGVIIVPGQAIFTTLAKARAESVSSLSVGTFPFVECIPVAKVTYQYSTAFGDAVGDARIVEVTRIVEQTFNVVTAASNHNSLGGLEGGTTGEYFHLTETEYLGYQPADTIYSQVSGWGGTYAKSGTTPDYATISTWIGTTGAGASTRVLLATGTANNSASVEFTTMDTTTYDRFYIQYSNVMPVTNATYLDLFASSNAGGTYWGNSQYYTVISYLQSGYGVLNEVNSIKLTVTGQTTTAAAGMSGEIWLHAKSYGTTTDAATYQGLGNYIVSNTSVMSFITGNLVPKATINALKFQAATGNLRNGIFRLYGET